MREILFKAKRKDNGRWEAGYYEKKTKWHRLSEHGEYVKTEKHYICVNMVSSEDSYIDRIEVIPETICQYTGLTDKNGSMIWENDVVKDNVIFGAVVWDEKNARFMIDDIHDGLQEYSDWWNEVEVIGNIFDNPALLEGGEC